MGLRLYCTRTGTPHKGPFHNRPAIGVGERRKVVYTYEKGKPFLRLMNKCYFSWWTTENILLVCSLLMKVKVKHEFLL
jgi:hypothetical protein